MRLTFTDGPLKGKSYKIAREATIGRGASCTIRVQDTTVSSRQCKIFFENGRPFIEDLQSTNRTLLNSEELETAALKDGDILQMGDSLARMEMVVESSIISVARTKDNEDVGANDDDPDVRDTDEAPGDIFATTTYRLKRTIAIGGMGTVYEAEQYGAEGFIKTVVIKAILPKYSSNAEFVEMFIGEAKLVADLVHQNIVQIYQLGRYDKGFYIAMEYIDGIDLAQFIYRHNMNKKPMPVDLATFIVSRICRGLEYAHNKRDENGELLGIVHRDIAPKNIMITNEGECKLTDFGVAKATHHIVLKEGEFLVGSFEYMSPEQASYEATDGRSDLYSLGLVFYELLTGVRVLDYDIDDDEKLLAKIREADIPDPRQYRGDIPEETVKILMKTLSKSPEDRYQKAGDLGYALEYQMYSKGYGPTIVALSRYVAEIFPELNFYCAPEENRSLSTAADVMSKK